MYFLKVLKCLGWKEPTAAIELQGSEVDWKEPPTTREVKLTGKSQQQLQLQGSEVDWKEPTAATATGK